MELVTRENYFSMVIRLKTKIEIKLPDGKLYIIHQLLSHGNDNYKLALSNLYSTKYLTVGLSLAPHTSSGYNVCKDASPACSADCLFFQGRARYFKRINLARIAKTLLFFQERTIFRKMLFEEIAQYRRSALLTNKQLAVRLNVLSDIPWERVYSSLFTEFQDIIFYDYTKRLERFNYEMPENYSLTASRSELNEEKCISLLSNKKTNVAVVFRKKKMPRIWKDFPVLDGNKNDLRFLDKGPGFIVGLSAKGSMKKDVSGFVEET